LGLLFSAGKFSLSSFIVPNEQLPKKYSRRSATALLGIYGVNVIVFEMDIPFKPFSEYKVIVAMML
jgi:hypothetical protein